MSNDQTDPPRDDVPRESFVRWQQTTLRQLGYSINLLLGFAGAALGFEIAQSLDGKIATCVCTIFALSLICLALSLLAGVIATVSRLWDFRITTRVAKMNWEKTGQSAAAERKRGQAELLGQITWALFWIQSGAFGVGILMAAWVFFPLAISRIN